MDKDKVIEMCQSQISNIGTRMSKNISEEVKATLIHARSTALLALAVAVQEGGGSKVECDQNYATDERVRSVSKVRKRTCRQRRR